VWCGKGEADLTSAQRLERSRAAGQCVELIAVAGAEFWPGAAGSQGCERFVLGAELAVADRELKLSWTEWHLVGARCRALHVVLVEHAAT
jgi:hypothetical protein